MANPGQVIMPQAYAGSQADGVWSREAAGDAAPGGQAMTLDAAFKLVVEEGGVVEATFPFHGDVEGSQLSFQIGDTIKVLQKDELWSWGQLVRTGEEGYFPHNYVQATFKPLPGMHELKMKMAIKRARQEALERGEDPDAAEAAIVAAANGGAQQQQQQQQPEPPPPEPMPVPEPEPEPEPAAPVMDGYGMGQYGMGEGQYGMGMDSMYGYGMQQQQPMPQPPPQPDYGQYGMGAGGYPMEANQGNGGGGDWSNVGDVDMAFGMWMDFIDGGNDPILPAAKAEEEAPSPADAGLDKRRSKRGKLARELVKSEESYVSALEALLDTIIKPCLGEGGRAARYPPVSHGEAQQMFGGLHAGEILHLNTELRNELRGRIKQWDDNSCLGDVFIQFAPSLRTYTEYCLQHEDASAQLSMLSSSNDSFRSLLQRSKQDPRAERRDAQDLLALPKKRIPEYRVALEGLLRYTDEDHADHPLLTKALEDLSDIANFIEEGARWRQNQARMAGIKARLANPPHDLLRPGRIFLRSGVLTKLGRFADSGVLTKLGRFADRADFFVLFNDGLLQARPQTFGTKYIFKRIVTVLRVELVGHLPTKTKAQYPFRIVTDGHIFLLTAQSSEQRTQWMKALTQVIKYGTRQLIHKGPLGLLKLDKDPVEVREEYFYVFSDVVVRGRALWRDKFKHKQTLDVTRVEENYVPMEQQYYGGGGLPKEISGGHGALDRCFRLIHIEGSTVVMAPTLGEKAKWIEALLKQQEAKREEAAKSVNASRQPASQDVFANADSDDDDDDVLHPSTRAPPPSRPAHRPGASNSSGSATRRSTVSGNGGGGGGSSSGRRTSSGAPRNASASQPDKPSRRATASAAQEVDLLGLSLHDSDGESAPAPALTARSTNGSATSSRRNTASGKPAASAGVIDLLSSAPSQPVQQQQPQQRQRPQQQMMTQPAGGGGMGLLQMDLARLYATGASPQQQQQAMQQQAYYTQQAQAQQQHAQQMYQTGQQQQQQPQQQAVQQAAFGTMYGMQQQPPQQQQPQQQMYSAYGQQQPQQQFATQGSQMGYAGYPQQQYAVQQQQQQPQMYATNMQQQQQQPQQQQYNTQQQPGYYPSSQGW